MIPAATKSNFLIFWLSGWVLFFVIGVLQPPTDLPFAELGMESHRRAGSADVVDAIHQTWQRAGLYGTATMSLVVDLFFIAALSIGGVLGGQLLRQNDGANIRRVGLLAIVAHVVFAVSDFAETASQLIQMAQYAGDDGLAMLAAWARPVKMQSFFIGTAALIIGYGAARLIASRNKKSN